MFKTFFHTRAEKKECDHVKDQVAVIGMYKSTGKKALYLVLPAHGRRVKYQIADNFLTAKTPYRNQNGNDNNDQRN